MRIAGDIDVMLARRVTLLILRPGSRSGWGSPATRSVLWPRPRRDTRSSIGCLPVRMTPPHGLPRRSVTPGNGPVSWQTASKTTAGCAPSATSVASRRSADCSSASRCSSSLAWVFAIAVARSSVNWLPAGVVCSLAPCYIPLQRPSHNVGPHSRQPLFGLIKEGVNLLHLVARPQTGRRELLVVGLIPCQRGGLTPRNVSRSSFRKVSTSDVA